MPVQIEEPEVITLIVVNPAPQPTADACCDCGPDCEPCDCC